MEVLVLEHDVGDDGKDGQGDAFLNDFQLNEVERSAVALEAHSVSWNLAAVFKEGDAPREGDDAQQRPMAGNTRLLKTKMPIPSKRHEYVA